MKQETAHKGFTLVEMLIVVAILAVLMTIVFRLGSLGGTDSRRTTTVVKMQKIENCLSGYYAAFGSYPPVKVHGWRDINKPVDQNGDQSESGSGSADSGSGLIWNRVNAACRSQPFGCEYPPNKDDKTDEKGEKVESEEETIEKWAREVSSRVGNSSEYPLYANGTWDFADQFKGEFGGPVVNEGGFKDEWDNPDWKAIKLFKFGVMSFLLPRYLFMMGGDGKCFGLSGEACAQWGDNNDLPCDPTIGSQYADWKEIKDYAQYNKASAKKTPEDLVRVANIPSQAVCARWMPNLEGLCGTLKTMKFFGINVSGSTGLSAGWEDSDGEIHPPSPNTHYSPSGSTPYRNASVTIYDGWGTEFYYYSPAPYQSYVVWSAGPNYKTFPPWMSLDSLKNDTDRKTAQDWKNDDIMQMSH